jgi:acetyl-CoA carboxylase biotin carboxylase subunit
MIKAAAGGGGRGMRIARNDPSLVNGFHAARSEAEACFGDSTVYIEKFVENPRHVEIQILGDRHGNVVYLGERDCSVQRRHQKLVEESPSPSVDPALREAMGKAAVAIAKESNYHNAGTVEFLLDKDKNFYFIEVNARIQVEHTVTELVTGVDLIQAQLKIASGEPLELTQDEVELRGHAIEVRINAEDPDRDFQPSPGRIDLFAVPGGPGIRWDGHAHGGYVVPPYYDSMIGKLLAHRKDRETARRTMLRALDEFAIEGIRTTIPLHRRILAHSDFRSGIHDTGFVERYFGGQQKVIRGGNS